MKAINRNRRQEKPVVGKSHESTEGMKHRSIMNRTYHFPGMCSHRLKDRP